MSSDGANRRTTGRTIGILHLDKAPDAFRTISEVADDLDIPQHVLRFWETRFTQIKPMKRSGGRRYYRPDDVDLLRGIRRLLYGEGYTIRGVQRILKENGIKSVQGLVDGQAVPRVASGAAPVAPRVQVKRPVVEDDHEDDEADAELEEEIADDLDAEDDVDVEADEADDEETGDEDEEADEAEAESEEDDTEDDAEDGDTEEDAEDEQEEPAPVTARRAPDIVPRREPDPGARREPPMVAAAPPVEPVLPRHRSRANPVLARPEPSMAPPVPRPAAASDARSSPHRRLRRERLEAVLDELLAARQALDNSLKDN